MRRIAFLVIAAAVLLLASCSGGEETRVQAPELLKAVPSDAISVSVLSKCQKGLEEVTDSTDLLRSIDFGRLSGSEAVLSKGNVGSVEELLVIDAGRASQDTSAAERKILDQAEALGLFAACVNDSLKCNVLLISRSETLVKLSLRHIEGGTSILDAPDFEKVLQDSDFIDGTALRLVSARKLPSESALEPFFTSRRMADFLKNAAEWIVMPNSGDTRQVYAVCQPSPKYFMNLVGALEPARSELSEILPESATFAVDFAIGDVENCRKAYNDWIDANSRSDKFSKAMNQLSSASGKDPLKWEKEMEVSEVAKVVFDGGEVLLVRSGHRLKAHEVEPYDYQGFVPALYGNIFAIEDQSSFASTRQWQIIGSAEAVAAFLTAQPQDVKDWPKTTSYALWVKDGVLLSSDRNSTVLINL